VRKLYALYVPAVVLLVGIAAFGLGRLSVTDSSPQSAAVAQTLASSTQISATDDEAAVVPATGPYVASKSGSKYYLTTCASAGRISDANKVYFQSAAAAQAAGYAPAANCPGL
jgi:hypothetical protein